MSDYNTLKAERNRLKAILDEAPQSRRSHPNWVATKKMHSDIQVKIKALFKENKGV